MFTHNRHDFSTALIRIKGELERRCRLTNWQWPKRPTSMAGGQEARVKKPVLIIGCGRSGTTMLFNLLNEHQDLTGTTGFPDGEDTEMWVKVGGALIACFGGVHSRSPIGHCFCGAMDGNSLTQGRINYIHDYVTKKYLKKGGPGRRLLNKNPHLSNKIKYIHTVFEDVKLIHVVRDPYAVIASWKVLLARYRNLLVEIPDSESACMNIFPNRGWGASIPILKRGNPNLYDPGDVASVRLLARFWKNINLYVLKQASDVKTLAIYTVRFEDICRDQKAGLSDVLDFCELSTKSDWILRVRPAVQTKWKRVLSPREIALVDEELGESPGQFGYPIVSRS